jgi:shikimate kinase
VQSIFITGIPTAGKSHLSRKLAAELEYSLFDVDTLREEMGKDSQLRPWVDFFFNLDEKEY